MVGIPREVHVSTVHTLLSLQLMGAKTQPFSSLHESDVHTLLSLHTVGTWIRMDEKIIEKKRRGRGKGGDETQRI